MHSRATAHNRTRRGTEWSIQSGQDHEMKIWILESSVVASSQDGMSLLSFILGLIFLHRSALPALYCHEHIASSLEPALRVLSVSPASRLSNMHRPFGRCCWSTKDTSRLSNALRESDKIVSKHAQEQTSSRKEVGIWRKMEHYGLWPAQTTIQAPTVTANSASAEPNRICTARFEVTGRSSPARGYNFGCVCSYIAGHCLGVRAQNLGVSNLCNFEPLNVAVPIRVCLQVADHWHSRRWHLQHSTKSSASGPSKLARHAFVRPSWAEVVISFTSSCLPVFSLYSLNHSFQLWLFSCFWLHHRHARDSRRRVTRQIVLSFLCFLVVIVICCSCGCLFLFFMLLVVLMLWSLLLLLLLLLLFLWCFWF